MALFFFSKAGLHRIVAYIFIGILFLAASYTSLTWGADIPQALLLFALIIVVSGILIGTRFALVVSVGCILMLFIIGSAQVNNIVIPITYWKVEPFKYNDVAGYSVTLGILTLVSWLFNREIEEALKRARRSEGALKKERDMLEVRVDERTKELNKVQLEKVLHLYRFADFGRITAGLFHDLVNPLTAVSLNLEQLLTQSKGFKSKKLADTRSYIKQAVVNTRHMERFVQSIRRQVQRQETKKIFSLNEEVILAMSVLNHKAAEKQVETRFIRGGLIRNYGSPTRFNQLVTNFLSNAIDACGDVEPKKRREIIIRLYKIGQNAVLVVQDCGCGIAKKNIKKIYDPFFTTKSAEKGTGFGLSICKDIVEKELGGKIKVKSKIGVGSTFRVEFPLKKKKIK